MRHFALICILAAWLASPARAITCLHQSIDLTEELAPPCRTVFLCACGKFVRCMRQRIVAIVRCEDCGEDQGAAFADEPCAHHLSVCPGHN
ncbi:uncharacterized protein PGTG_22414 [Puccinia graminis f. sp. tritici CRL 75-36-700-3]|uniref:Uncharacterized protein n=1 Tax=Puccinia graminis f. sp. tritici (strain CRL 75-36-700-3 / race SCCL) TaxID=418459 RepID=H6QUH9_PUCGT|nr:uncharacterized protein PGTG_22414 [Puccinia graminis f. sp. tritici CRL 75-36-700-3]EHS64691.1 hypothetical protein PGTG_22414 [Puccinia graminis f. sp. tritici CRL 75-36-700-3]